MAGSRLRRISTPYRIAGSADVALRCRETERGVLIEGSISAALEAQCQRCLAWMPLPITAAVDVIGVARLVEQAEDDEDEYVLLEDGRLDLVRLVEEELLLNCPMIPAHAVSECGAAAGTKGTAPDRRKRPFAGLKDLLAGKPDRD
jgi:uncharacterized protein